MRIYKVEVDWEMIVLRRFSKVIGAECEMEVYKIVEDMVDAFAFEDCIRQTIECENIYTEKPSQIVVKEIK